MLFPPRFRVAAGVFSRVGCLLLACAAVASAASIAPSWDRPLGSADEPDRGLAIARDAAGNVYLAAGAVGPQTGQVLDGHYSRVVKLAATDGAQLWEKKTVPGVTLHSFAVNAAGDLVVASAYQGGSVTRLSSATGEPIWDKQVAFAGAGNVALDANADVFTLQENRSWQSGVWYLRVVKHAAADGEPEWTREITKLYGHQPRLILDAAGNAVVAFTRTEGQKFTAETVVLAGDTGVERWRDAVQVSQTVNISLAGLACDGAGNPVLTIGWHNYGGFLRTVKYAAATGERLWVRDHRRPTSDFSEVRGLAVDASGGVAVAGAGTTHGAYVLKYNAAGEVQWQQQFGDERQVQSIAFDGAGQLVVHGFAYRNRGAAYTALLQPDGRLAGEHWYFGGDGSVQDAWYWGNRPNLLATGHDGRIAVAAVVAGNGSDDLSVLSYLPTDDAPVVTLVGDPVVTLEAGIYFTGDKATASDPQDGTVTALRSPTAAFFDASAPGEYLLNWTATDSTGLTGGASRRVKFVDTTPPSITGAAEVSFERNSRRPEVTQGLVSASDPYGVARITADPAFGTKLPLGTTNVTFTAYDEAGNSAQKIVKVTVVDTVAPFVSIADAPVVLVGGVVPDYVAGAIALDESSYTVTQSIAAGTVLPPGEHEVEVAAVDEAGNRGVKAFRVSSRLAAPLTAIAFDLADAPPGAGTAGAPPALARFTGFGLPAIDEQGRLAFAGKWATRTTAGAGIFTSDRSIAQRGQRAAASGAAKFAAFNDPVIAEGRVAFVATLSGVAAPLARGVFSEASGALAMLAQSGKTAPGRPTAKFTAFSSVALAGDATAFFGQAKLSSGLVFRGVWASQGAGPLEALLYEGQAVGAETIKALVSFQAGAGSAAQGRGCFVESASGPVAHALAHCQSGAQLVLRASFGGAVEVIAASGPSFESFGLPMWTPTGAGALQAITGGAESYMPKGSRGIFTYGKLAETFLPVTLKDPSAAAAGLIAFSAQQDPVVSDDGAIAFIGTPTSGSRTPQVYFRGVNALLLNVAGTGSSAAEVSSATWATFDSLAIANARGPLFSATLQLGGAAKVDLTNHRGVWAADYAGKLRLLFRTGDTIEGRKLRQFSTLLGSPGSTGVTRSFNQAGQLAWRATLDGGKQALVITAIP